MDKPDHLGYCPFRSVIPTAQAKLGHAKTGMSERDCDGPNCMLWLDTGEEAGCCFLLASRAFLKGR